MTDNNSYSNSNSNSNNKKKQHTNHRLYFRSITLPPPKLPLDTDTSLSSGGSNGDNDNGRESNTSDVCAYSPHFLSALQLLAHVIVPLRKALVHFYMSYRNKEVTKLEWQTLLAFGQLFRELTSSPSSSAAAAAGTSGGSSVASGSMLSGISGDDTVSSVNDEDLQQQHRPVQTESFFPILYKCLINYNYTTKPDDATEAMQVVLQTLQSCVRTIPVTNHVWSALLDKACMGLVVEQNLVGRSTQPIRNFIVQRTNKERCMLWCPHSLPISDCQRLKEKNNNKTKNDDDDVDDEDPPTPSLQQLLEADCAKRPIETTARKYHDFDKKNSYTFEVKIPMAFMSSRSDSGGGGGGDSNTNTKKAWNTTRSMAFDTVTGYLFLGIQRRTKCGNNEFDRVKFDRTEVEIPSQLDLTKLLSPDCKKKHNINTDTRMLYELIGGVLFDDGDYVAVLRDPAREKKHVPDTTAAKNDDDDTSDAESEEDDEAWKLMESEEVIPMSESDVLEFLKGEGNEHNDSDDDIDDDDSDDEEEFGPCGTMAVYKLMSASSSSKRQPKLFEEMDSLLSDIIISQVGGKLENTGNTDYYIEEEIIEEEIIE